MIRIIVLLMMVSVAMCSCEGPQGPQGEAGLDGQAGPQGDPGSSDRQIRLEFDFLVGSSTTSTSDQVLGVQSYIVSFDIRNYLNIDSVVVVTLINSNVSGVQAVSSLYNATDNLPIAGSEMVSGLGSSEWVRSRNILSAFPEKEIDLTLAIRTTNSGQSVVLSRGVVLIYRTP